MWMNECKPTIPLQKALGETKTIYVNTWKDTSYCHRVSFTFIFQESNTFTNTFLTHLAKHLVFNEKFKCKVFHNQRTKISFYTLFF